MWWATKVVTIKLGSNLSLSKACKPRDFKTAVWPSLVKTSRGRSRSSECALRSKRDRREELAKVIKDRAGCTSERPQVLRRAVMAKTYEILMMRVTKSLKWRAKRTTLTSSAKRSRKSSPTNRSHSQSNEGDYPTKLRKKLRSVLAMKSKLSRSWNRSLNLRSHPIARQCPSNSKSQVASLRSVAHPILTVCVASKCRLNPSKITTISGLRERHGVVVVALSTVARIPRTSRWMRPRQSRYLSQNLTQSSNRQAEAAINLPSPAHNACARIEAPRFSVAKSSEILLWKPKLHERS